MRKFEQLKVEDLEHAFSQVLSEDYFELTGHSIDVHIANRLLKYFLARLRQVSSIVDTQ
jgi:hypothetical protein